jgi:hypothetical protein
MNTDVPLDQLAARLEALRSERNALASTRTREDIRALVESWLAAALRQFNGATSYVLNGRIDQASVQSVIAEFMLDSPDLIAFIAKKVEAMTELSDRAKKQRLAKLGAEIATVEKELLAARKAAALAALEAEYANEAA